MESQYGQGSGLNATSPFMSTTDRGDFWKNELNAPYTKQTYLENPGPGQYEAGSTFKTVFKDPKK